MSTGRRTLALLLFLAVVAFVLVPGLMADRVEREFRLLATLASEAQGMDLTITEYRRGWFGAEADSTLSLLIAGDPVTVPVRHDIRHGPTLGLLAAQVDSHLDGSEADVLTELDLRLELGFTGRSEFIATLAPHHSLLPDEPHLTLDHDGASARLTLNRARDHYTFSAELDHLALDDGGDALLALDGVSAAAEGHRTDSADGVDEPFWNSEASLAIARLQLLEPDMVDAMTATGVHLDASQQSDKGTVRLTHGGRFEALALPGFSAHDGKYHLTLDGLDRLVWDEFQRRANAIHDQGLSLEAREALLTQAFLKTFPDFLAGRPTLTLDPFRVTTDHGLIEGELAIGLDEGPNDVRAAQVFALLGRLEGDGWLRMPEASLVDLLAAVLISEARTVTGGAVSEARLEQMATEMARQQVRQLRGMAILERVDNDALLSRIGLRGGTLLVNGEEYLRLF